MKKISILILILILTFSITACSGAIVTSTETENGSDTSTEKDTSGESENKYGVISPEKYEVTISYVGAGDKSQDYEIVREKALNSKKSDIYGNLRYPIYKMDTKEDLENFKSDFEEIFVMDSPYDNFPSFENAVATCDEGFFEANALFIIYLGGTSSSCLYDVTEVLFDGFVLKFEIRQTNDPIVTNCDEIGYLFTVKISKSEIKDAKMFDAR